MTKHLCLLLTAAVLTNAVNVNTTYCMDIEKEEIESQSILQQNLNTNFEKPYNEIRTTHGEKKQELLKGFCNCILRNNGKNLKTVLSDDFKIELDVFLVQYYFTTAII